MSKKPTSAMDVIGGLFLIAWVLLSAATFWNNNTIGVSLGVVFLVVLLFVGNRPISARPKLDRFTVNHVFILFGLLMFAGVMASEDVFKPILEKHSQYFTMRAYGLNGFERLWANFSAWPVADQMKYFVAPVVFIAFIVAGTGRLGFMLCSRDTAEEKLLKHSAKNKPKDAKHYSFKELKKIGYESEWVPLGVNLWEPSGSQPVGMRFEILNRHTMLVGTTGSGKTTTLYHFIVSALCHDKAIVFIDAKGDVGNIKKMRHFCESVGRRLHIVRLGGEGGYNPLAVGTLDELKDKIIGIFDWSEDYYKESASRAIRLLIQIMRLVDIPVNLGSVVDYSDYDRLSEYVLRHKAATAPTPRPAPPAMPAMPDPSGNIFERAAASPPVAQVEPEAAAAPEADEVSKLMSKLKSIDPKSRAGIRDRLAAIAEGDAAEMFMDPNPLNLSQAIENGDAVLFSIPALRFGELSQGFGRLIINDIRACVSIHDELAKERGEKAKRVCMIFDEFSVFASKQVVNIVNQSRDAGFEVLLSFQSLSDIDRLQDGEALRKQIIENCNSLIVQKQNEQEGREVLAKTFGTRDSTKLTIQEDDTGGGGAGSLREVQEFIVNPNDLASLEIGQAFIKICDIPGAYKIQVPLQEQLL